MRYFSVAREKNQRDPFMQACFGLVTERFTEPSRSVMYSCEDEAFELFAKLDLGEYADPCNVFDRGVVHYEGALKTTVVNDGVPGVKRDHVIFHKHSYWTRPDDKCKIQLNHMYENLQESDDSSDSSDSD